MVVSLDPGVDVVCQECKFKTKSQTSGHQDDAFAALTTELPVG